MTRNSASGEDAIHWVVGGLKGRWVTATRWPWASVRETAPPYEVDVRLGRSDSGRLFVTGLRIGRPDGHGEYEIKNLRNIHLGEILRGVREALVSREPYFTMPLPPDGRTYAEMLLGSADPASATVHRGPNPDYEADARTREVYEAFLAEGASKTEAVTRTSEALSRSESQVYRRLARTRPKEDK